MNINDIMPNINLPQRTVLGIVSFLAVLVCITFIYSLLQWHNDWKLAHEQTESTSLVKTNNETQLIIASVPDAHLFGKPTPKLAPITEVPISSLQLQVTGIVKESDHQSRALISTAGQPSKIYKIGDPVSSGVTLYDIKADTIILENNGRMEKLPLLRQKLQFKPRTKEDQ